MNIPDSYVKIRYTLSMKKLFLLPYRLYLFAYESPKMSQACKELAANPNWESPDKYIFYTLYSNPVHDVFLTREESVKLFPAYTPSRKGRTESAI